MKNTVVSLARLVLLCFFKEEDWPILFVAIPTLKLTSRLVLLVVATLSLSSTSNYLEVVSSGHSNMIYNSIPGVVFSRAGYA